MPFTSDPSVTSSSLLSIISGLLVSVAIELVVFLLDVAFVGGETITGSFACPELRDIQEKGLVNFRVGAEGAACLSGAPFAEGVGDGLGLVLAAGGSVLEGVFAGDQGIETKLLSDIFFAGAF